MVHQRLTDGPARLRRERVEHVVAVFRGLFRQVRAGDSGAGGHDVDAAEQLVARRAGGHVPRPAHQERHPVPAFPDVRLDAPVDVAGVVSVPEHRARLSRHVRAVARGRAVVAGEYEQRVVRLSRFL